jgi:hypothetical protein
MSRSVLALCAPLLAVSACGGSDSPAPSADSAATPSRSAAADDPLGHISSCEQVAPLVASYTTNLLLTDSSTVDQWGINCAWEPSEDETDMANNRSVSVSAVKNEPSTPPPALEGVLKMDGAEQIEDPWLKENDGVAYSLGMTTAVAGAITTTVWTPAAEVTVAGGTWDGLPALDGPAALSVAQQLLMP